jgi:cysteinyl-tRNA synthetase
MDDDFNTPVALSELQSLARVVNTAKAAGRADEASAAAGELRALGSRLGLLGREPEAFLRKRPKCVAVEKPGQAGEGQGDGAGEAGASLTDADIDRMIAERAAARKAKNFAESDRIRDELAAAGVVLEDQPGGKTLWRRG